MSLGWVVRSVALVGLCGWLALAAWSCCACPEGGLIGGDSGERATHPPKERVDGSLTLSSPGVGVRQLSSDKTHLFWARGFRAKTVVMSVPKAGGRTRALFRPGHNVERITSFRDGLYVAAWNGVWRVSLDALRAADKGQGDDGARDMSALTPRAVLKGARLEVHEMVINKRHLVFVSDGGALYRVDPQGGAPALIEGVGTLGSKHSTNLGLHKGYLYWSNNKVKAVKRARLGRDGQLEGEVETVVEDVFPSEDHALRFSRTHVYFYRSIPRSFGRAPLGGGALELVEPRAGGHFRGWDMDDDAVYWGRGWAVIGSGQERRRRNGGTYKTRGRKKGGGGVMRAPLELSGDVDPKRKGPLRSENLNPDTGKVEGIVVDKKWIYWLDNDEGVVAKMRKPR